MSCASCMERRRKMKEALARLLAAPLETRSQQPPKPMPLPKGTDPTPGHSPAKGEGR